MRRTTPKKRPPEPPEERPDDWTPPNVIEDFECAVCGDTFNRHEEDPPCCSQDCWKQLRSERPTEDPR